MIQFLIKQGYDVSAHEHEVHMKLFNSVDKIMEKCFSPVIHHLAVTIKAKVIPAE